MSRRGLEGTRYFEGTWYVNERAFRSFLERKERQRRNQLQHLAEERRKELLESELKNASWKAQYAEFKKQKEYLASKRLNAQKGQLSVRPHPLLRIDKQKRDRREKLLLFTNRITVGVFIFFLIGISTGVAFEIVAPPGSAHRAILKNNYESAKRQFAAASSFPLLDSFALNFFKTVCPYFGMCPPTQSLDAYMASRDPQIVARTSQQQQQQSTSSPPVQKTQPIVQTIVNQPTRAEPVERVIERVVETQRIVAAAGGLTEEILTERLNALDGK
ncbi:hypothetical protein HY417_03720, partial [Candidatus Kaiserbacteria bacterium]|nr:hypothetical protein [Candidatus Kaiserbacteria bacterium]